MDYSAASSILEPKPSLFVPIWERATQVPPLARPKTKRTPVCLLSCAFRFLHDRLWVTPRQVFPRDCLASRAWPFSPALERVLSSWVFHRCPCQAASRHPWHYRGTG